MVFFSLYAAALAEGGRGSETEYDPLNSPIRINLRAHSPDASESAQNLVILLEVPDYIKLGAQTIQQNLRLIACKDYGKKRIFELAECMPQDGDIFLQRLAPVFAQIDPKTVYANIRTSEFKALLRSPDVINIQMMLLGHYLQLCSQGNFQRGNAQCNHLRQMALSWDRYFGLDSVVTFYSNQIGQNLTDHEFTRLNLEAIYKILKRKRDETCKIRRNYRRPPPPYQR